MEHGVVARCFEAVKDVWGPGAFKDAGQREDVVSGPLRAVGAFPPHQLSLWAAHIHFLPFINCAPPSFLSWPLTSSSVQRWGFLFWDIGIQECVSSWQRTVHALTFMEHRGWRTWGAGMQWYGTPCVPVKVWISDVFLAPHPDKTSSGPALSFVFWEKHLSAGSWHSVRNRWHMVSPVCVTPYSELKVGCLHCNNGPSSACPTKPACDLEPRKLRTKKSNSFQTLVQTQINFYTKPKLAARISCPEQCSGALRTGQLDHRGLCCLNPVMAGKRLNPVLRVSHFRNFESQSRNIAITER